MNRVEFDQVMDQMPPRKKEYLKLFLLGYSDKKISKALNVTPSAVAHHITETCDRFGLSNGEGEHFVRRYDLFDIFIEHRSDWVSPDKIKEYSSKPVEEPPYPGGGLQSDSPFYIERSPNERNSQRAIRQPGGLLRICAPRRMGKTSLINRLLSYAKGDLAYEPAMLSFYKLESSMLEDLEQLLVWFCESLTHELKLPSKREDYWNKSIGCKDSCTRYVEEYILAAVKEPIVIAMDDVDRLFEHPTVAIGFFSLLRGWTEESKIKAVWQNFRQIIAYSTDIYIKFPLSQSPFNVGHPVKLPPLTSEQIVRLAQQYHGVRMAQFGGAEATKLLGFVGGNPHLIQLALYHLHTEEMSLVDLQNNEQVLMEIYENYLDNLLRKLETYPELLTVFKQMVMATGELKMDQKMLKQLTGLGVVQQSVDGQVKISCQLYQKYFMRQWS